MGLETGTYLNDLVTTNPVGATDQKQYGDDHLRLIKSTLKATFPGLSGAFARVSTKSIGYTVVANDNTVLFNCTSALTLSITAAATLGNQHIFIVVANGGDVTLDPNGSETVNGVTSIVIPNGFGALVWCTGAAFIALMLPLASSVFTLLSNLYLGAGKTVVFEGTTDDAYEATLSGGEPTADRTHTLPDATGTVAHKQGVASPGEIIVVAVSDETTAITTGTAKVTFRMPFAMTLTSVRASLSTASSSGTPTFDINEGGVSILSTKLTIDASEKTSTTAAAAAVISDASLADDAEITIDIDTAGTGAKGAKVTLIGYRT